MSSKLTLDELVEWVKEKPNCRSVDVSIERNLETKDVDVVAFAYDSELKVGQRIRCMDELDLDRLALEKERNLYEELKKKFET